jgi:pimeloyl-ACP methyl ester carboxylesterase
LRRLSAALALLLASTACGGTHAAKPERIAGQAGFLLEANGHRLYYECAGRGSPTVVLEAGLGGDHRAWAAVAPELAYTTRTCAYDRAGLGFSAPDGSDRTGREQVDDLHALLAAARIPPPYVLVGHSYGGLLVHEFADAHPADVAGLVLVDALHPAQARRFLAALGPPRPGESPVRTQLRAFLRQEPQNTEGLDMRATFAQARKAGPVGDMPLVVITAGLENDPSLEPGLKRTLDRTWLSLQDDLSRLSTDSIHVIAVRSHHNVMSFADQPELVVDAVRAVVHAARTKQRLTRCGTLFAPPGARCVSG